MKRKTGQELGKVGVCVSGSVGLLCVCVSKIRETQVQMLKGRSQNQGCRRAMEQVA